MQEHSHEKHHHHEHCTCGHHHDHHREEVHFASHIPQAIYILEHLGCANCASKMEQKINALEEVEFASITFATKQLHIVSKEREGLLPKLQEICASIEPEVIVRETAEQVTKERNPAKKQKREIIEIGISFVLVVVALWMQKSMFWTSLAGFLLAYLLMGRHTLKKAVVHLGKGHVFDENFLMSLATIAAFSIGEYVEAAGVMLFFRLGELFEHLAVEKSRKQIMDAVDMRPETVSVVCEHGVHVIPAKEAKENDIVLVRVGERIPLDGIIVEGKTRIDTSSVTGEPTPVSACVGDFVLSGCVNTSAVVKIKVRNILEESMVTKILRCVEGAASGKPKTERFITRFARVYTPIVVATAFLTAILPSLITGEWSRWIYTAITFLVISCPCALVLSVPLAFFSGIGQASKKGILFKGGVALETMAKVQALVLDKTGTITDGVFAVQNIESVCAEYQIEDVLQMAAACEQYSTHPIATSIMAAARENQIRIEEVKNPEEVAGRGVRATWKEDLLLCGSRAFMEEHGVKAEQMKHVTYGTQVFVARNQKLVGCIVIADRIKEEAKSVIGIIKKNGIHTAMLTGDVAESANIVSAEIGIEEVYAQMLPEDKLKMVRDIRTRKGITMFVGDGINDAPVLAGADVGAAMGSGADAAMEAADVVFMNDSLSGITDAMSIAKETRKIASENIVFALAIKLLVMVLGLFGNANMWMAVFADTGVAMLCVLNSIRILRKK